MRYMKLTAVLRSGRLLPLLTILILLHVEQSTSNLLSVARKQDDFKIAENVESNESVETIEPHPTIVYKEDFVREDYDALKSKKSSYAKRKVKQNGMFFDILPQEPIFEEENYSDVYGKNLQVDIIPLTEDLKDSSLNRKRRNSEDTHTVKKRNPYIQHYAEQYPSSNQLQYQYNSHSNYPRMKHPVQGVLWNGIDRTVPSPAPLPSAINIRFGNDDEEDRVVWDRFRAPTRVLGPASIFHDSNPANADFGFMTKRPQTTVTDRPMRPTLRPTFRPTASIFHDSNPNNADLSFLTRRPNLGQTTPPTTISTQQVAANAASPSQSTITACVWAIVNCCSNRDQNVRYSCFEDHGCSGAFFDLNPCGDFKNRVIEYVADVIN